MQQMRFAHADARMNIKGVIFQRLVGSVFGDLQRSGVGQPVRRADDEGLEGVARVERRSFKPIKPRPPVASGHIHYAERGNRRWRRLRPGRGHIIRWRSGLQLLNRGEMRLANPKFQAIHTTKLGAAARKKLL
jgi:hypothetical protein